MNVGACKDCRYFVYTNEAKTEGVCNRNYCRNVVMFRPPCLTPIGEKVDAGALKVKP